MDLVIGNKIITTPMETILFQLQSELSSYNGKLKEIGRRNGQNINVTCPCNEHKGGFERHPSCQIFADPDDDYTEYGTAHCFSCGFAMKLPKFVGYCFDEDESFGEEWLLSRCSTAFISETKYLPEIVIDNNKYKNDTKPSMSEDELKKYAYYHEYMWKRKLSKEVVDRFEVGYDPKQNMLIFPVRDEKGILRFVTGRSVLSHRFMIPSDVDKPVYLLYYMLRNNIKRVGVAESQINALYLNSLGIPCVGLFGTGSYKQLSTLRKSGITTFDLYFDGDVAGDKGAKRFIENIGPDKFVNIHQLPRGKDVNDLTYEEICNLPMI